jgi:hypothetical protein
MPTLTKLDTVANTKPIARDRLTLVELDLQAISFLPVGQVGTVLEIHGEEQPQYLIEFADLEGREYAMAVLRPDEVLALHYGLTLVS